MTGFLKEKKQSVRTCVCCRSAQEKKSLVRVIRTPDGEVKVDPTSKAAGRGAYICHSRKCLECAIKQNKFKRALRCDIPMSILNELTSFVADEETTGTPMKA